jgi:site-specific recombinase XerC
MSGAPEIWRTARKTRFAKLIEAARGNRYSQRDATMILVAYRHGFRASEIVDLEWSAIDCVRAEMHVRRATHFALGQSLDGQVTLSEVNRAVFTVTSGSALPIALGVRRIG